MAEATEVFPAPPPDQKPLYPWAQWSDGWAWKLYHGVDYKSTKRGLVAAARGYARRHNLNVRYQGFKEGSRTGVVVQFWPPDQPAPPIEQTPRETQ